MKEVIVTLNSTTPLLMNYNQAVNPLHPLAIELKKYTGKRKKTDEDNLEILKIKWRAGLYYTKETGPYIPAENIEACLRDAAKRSKRGKDVTTGIRVLQSMIPLEYEGPRDVEELIKSVPIGGEFSDVRVGRIQGSSILVSRPRFNRWSITFPLNYDEDIFDEGEIKDILETAGKYVGLCDFRQRYGKFEASIKKHK